MSAALGEGGPGSNDPLERRETKMSLKHWGQKTLLLAATTLVALLSTSVAFAAGEDGSDASSEDPVLLEDPPEAEVVGWQDSEKNTDYAPKSDAEGATWTFDPQKVELSAGTSDTGTNFQGARILKGNEDVVVQGTVTPGIFEDTDNPRYSYWQGSTLFFGVESPETENSVDAIAEFFWFESSIPRGSDFYVMQLKVKSSPNPWDKWILAKEPGFIDDYILFWNDVQPSQHVDVFMEPGGAHGSLRWDFCVPFETYKWEPVKTMQISESYGAGYSLNATANGQGKASQQFKEGGLVADLTADANIQAKGYVNNDFKVQSQYTITLYKWQMLVQSGGEGIHYKLVVLPHDEENEQDSGYYEYFIVMQATRGTPVHIDNIEVGGMFRHKVPVWFDGYEGLSASLSDIWITPPRGVCLPGDIAPAGTCKQAGVCGLAEAECVDNHWVCPVINLFEQVETSCDGLDNDCDGQTDEDIVRECTSACGGGYESCLGGKYQGCDAPAPTEEICGDGVDNDCDGKLDNGCETPAEPVNDEPTNPIDDPTDGSTDENPFDSGDNPTNTDKPNPGATPKTTVPSASGSAGCSASGSTPSPAAAMLVFLALMALAVRRRRLS
ncbi:MAG: hypothetical protein ACI9OJ_003856 [Myxococcota bacterium]|jgi:uncharacterized protein (TIGR03382 family)